MEKISGREREKISEVEKAFGGKGGIGSQQRKGGKEFKEEKGENFRQRISTGKGEKRS